MCQKYAVKIVKIYVKYARIIVFITYIGMTDTVVT